ncbi:MAG: lipid-A-disaccharide synthase [Proteobacteria bacterium]|nr:lipid-A-disaccharide synthase [Pseudomonadota bacterium]
MFRIGIVAGEASGDLLGAKLIQDLKEKYSDIEVVGIGGKHLIENGCQSLFDMERLSVMGIFEVLARYYELLGIRRKLTKYFVENPPDIFIGIDAPDFNLTLEENLRSQGIRTVHYVSPSVWAWRESRLKKISRAVDLMLVLFPFELPYYEKNNITAQFVGHPLATQLNETPDKNGAREVLDLPRDKVIIALMPGSRKSEINQHSPIFLETALWCQERHDNLHFVANMVDEQAREIFSKAINEICPDLPITIFTGDSRLPMEASDLLLLASGTITLEAMFLKKPMVVAYRVSWLTYQIFSRLIHAPYAALPNLLADKLLVPECLQNDCTPEKLGAELSAWLNDEPAVEKLKHEFDVIHQGMVQQKRHSAVDAIMLLISH